MVHGWPMCTSQMQRRLIFQKNLLKLGHPRVPSIQPIACNSNIQEIGKQAYKQGTMKIVHGWPMCTSSSRLIFQKNVLKLGHHRVNQTQPITCNSNIQDIGKQAYKQGTMKSTWLAKVYLIEETYFSKKFAQIGASYGHFNPAYSL